MLQLSLTLANTRLIELLDLYPVTNEFNSNINDEMKCILESVIGSSEVHPDTYDSKVDLVSMKCYTDINELLWTLTPVQLSLSLMMSDGYLNEKVTNHLVERFISRRLT